jgi:hypothetical protein
MSPDSQRIAIAEACGWTKCRLAIKGAGAPERGKSPYGVPPRRGYEVSLPNYTQDLNALHEAEKVLPDGSTYWEFIRILDDIVKHGPHVDYVADRASATAAQRAEAFLRTLRKWEGAK